MTPKRNAGEVGHVDSNVPAVLTVSELCARWRCTRKSVLAKIHAGELTAFRVGERAYRVAVAEVLRIERGTGQAA
jgi:excisionase family DNA binding protein